MIALGSHVNVIYLKCYDRLDVFIPLRLQYKCEGEPRVISMHGESGENTLE